MHMHEPSLIHSTGAMVAALPWNDNIPLYILQVVVVVTAHPLFVLVVRSRSRVVSLISSPLSRLPFAPPSSLVSSPIRSSPIPIRITRMPHTQVGCLHDVPWFGLPCVALPYLSYRISFFFTSPQVARYDFIRFSLHFFALHFFALALRVFVLYFVVLHFVVLLCHLRVHVFGGIGGREQRRQLRLCQVRLVFEGLPADTPDGRVHPRLLFVRRALGWSGTPVR